ncbi:MAG TPA: amino acid adenylation domain-containing protein [Candidatus Stackebrandtia excrementipullorum]|nr:amino acid adenylation domain-containing protein [Candidatus Stackebrandtia excrementipullorum]
MMRSTPSPDFGLYFFGNYPQDVTAADTYRTLLEAARFGDESGFSSVWLPERHFHSFGGVFPNPSVLAAAVAARTRSIRINAGSVVLPLHDPIRVAEEWSVVDNLSGGRVGIGVASGWNSNDFVFFPERFGAHRDLMYEQIEEVRRLWRGHSLSRTGGTGRPVEVSLYPRPLQPDVDMYTAVVGRRESFAQAARANLGVITNLMTQDISALADNIAYYRSVRAQSGLDPAGGRVSVLVHTYIHEDASTARRRAYEPLTDYMRASLSLFGQVTNSLGFNIDLDRADEDDLAYLFSRAYDRYCDSRALIGSPSTCAATVEALADAGVDEIASLVDFGMPADHLLEGLPQLDTLRRRSHEVHVHAPMTDGQQTMWVHEQLVPGNNAQNEPKAVRLVGHVDIAALDRAVRRLVEAHPALRTVYRDVDGVPSQVLLPEMSVSVEVHDRTGTDELTVASETISHESRRRFDLAQGPVFFCSLHTVAVDRHILVLSFHHIAVDALSVKVLTRRLSQLYAAESSGRPAVLPMPSRRPLSIDVAPEKVARDLAYWRSRLAGPLPVLQLPTDRQRPSRQTHRARARFVELDAELTSAIRALGNRNGATLFMTLLTGLAITLRRFTGQDDLIVGVPVSRRSPDQQDAVGLLINTIPLRFDMTGDPTFSELLQRVRRVALDGYDHASAPLEDIIAQTGAPRDPSRSPLYQITAEFKNGEAFDLDLPGVTAVPLDVGREVTACDIMIHLTHRDGGVMAHLEYNTDLFDDATVTRLGGYLRQTLEIGAREPDRRLSASSELIETDSRLLEKWSNGPAVPSATETVVEQIVGHARRKPDAVAVGDETGHITYRDMVDDALRVCAALHEHGVAPGDVVATWLPRSRRLPSILLGIMWARAAYLPLDPALGPARIDRVLTDSRARIVLSTDRLRSDLPPLSDLVVVDVDTVTGDESVVPPPEPPPVLDDAAYVIYTSGSTGHPKGIVATHGNLAWLSEWFGRRFEFDDRGRAAAVCGQSWDVSVMELWPMLAAGGRVTMATDAVRRDPAQLSQWLTDENLDFALLPTPLGQEVLALPSSRQPRVRFIMLGGDLLTVLPRPDSPFALVNIYGPAETTVVVTTYPTTSGSPSPVPLGSPVDGAHFRVLDEAGNPTPVGVPGELYIGGDCVTRGYLHAPRLTEERFVVDPSAPGGRLYRSGDRVRWTNDGVLEFCGRTDDQVKVRGYRVEPGETAAILRELPGVSDAVVLPRRNDHGDATLAAYIVATGDTSGLVRRLHAELAHRLPEYLIPGAWAVLNRLPRNANDKVERSQLPHAKPLTAFEHRPDTPSAAPNDALGSLWMEVLDVDVLDETQSFFEAGGHSITAMRLLNRVREALGMEFSVSEFYREPTLAALRRHLTSDDTLRSGPISYQQVGMVDGLTRATGSWNIVVHLEMTGDLDVAALQAAATAVIERHESLRTRFHRDGTEWVQEVLSPQPVPLTPVEVDDYDELSKRFAEEPFDVAVGHLVRFRLLRRGQREWRFVVVVHHAVCDGWGVSLLLADLAAAYRAARRGDDVVLPAATQSIDYAVWQQRHWDRSLFDGRLGYWRESLRDRPLTVALPATGDPADVPAAFVRREVPDGLSGDVDRLAAKLGCTPFAVWAAALGIVLSRRTDQLRLTLGTPYAGREHPDHDTVMAVLAMVSLLRIDIDPAVGFGRLAVDVLSDYAATVDNFVPLRRILDDVKEHRDDVPAVMPVSFLYQSSMTLDLEWPDLDVVVDERTSGAPRRRTSFFVEPGTKRHRFGVIADGSLHEPSTLGDWLSEWLDVLSAGVSDPDTPVADLLTRE